MAALGEDNGEDGMGTAAGLIHVGGSHSPGGEGSGHWVPPLTFLSLVPFSSTPLAHLTSPYFHSP